MTGLLQQDNNQTPMLHSDRVSKWFGEVIAVNDCTLSLGPGVSGLLGLNGAGKTTLFKLLSGLITPSQGEVLVSAHRFLSRIGCPIRLVDRSGISHVDDPPDGIRQAGSGKAL
jgi:ABC-2 type transport system ATP-binding protein